MNIADRLFHLGSQPRYDWLPGAYRALPPLACALLTLGIAYQLAQITWALLPSEAYGLRPEVARNVGGGSSTPAVDFSVLRDWYPFGRPPAENPAEAAPPPPESIVDAPNTTLNLKLTGVVVQKVNEDSEAMIESGNQPQKRYSVGATIEGASGATLHQVFHDRVILNRNGRLETLRFPEQLSARPVAAVAGRRPSTPPIGNPSSLRQVISANASRLTNIIRMAPHVEGGNVIGFRVNPGPDEDAFNALGLRAGDVVTDINGLTLDDPSRGIQAFEALGESTMANVTVMRDGQPQVIVIDTSQLNALSEDRQ